MAMKRVVRIDALPESDGSHSCYDAVVWLDVLLSSTTLVSAVACGRRVLAAASPLEAHALQERVPGAVVATDSMAEVPAEWIVAGPAWLAAHSDARPLVHLSPLAERLAATPPGVSAYVACLRNLKATALAAARSHRRVAVLAAGDAGEACAADRMAAAWLAAQLTRLGFALEDRKTANEVGRWGAPDVALIGWARSAERLRSRGLGADVAFVLDHVDDLQLACGYRDRELRALPRAPASPRAALEPALAPQLLGAR